MLVSKLFNVFLNYSIEVDSREPPTLPYAPSYERDHPAIKHAHVFPYVDEPYSVEPFEHSAHILRFLLSFIHNQSYINTVRAVVQTSVHCNHSFEHRYGK